MKRLISVILIALIICSVLPHAAFGDTVSQHTVEADRVLIYNPLPYAENGNMLYSGTLPKPEDEEPISGDPLYHSGMHRTGKDLSIGRKDANTQDFWICTDLMTYRYDKCTFRLAKEGEHCLIWTLEGDDSPFTEEQATAMLEQFENVIYPSDTASFGSFRDLGGNGKLYILTYTMNSSSICGFFDSYDLYTKEEIAVIDPDDPDSYNYLPIINVNTRMADREQIVYGTLAHEFQHLIQRSAVLASSANADRLGFEQAPGVWLNEGFSMAAEELTYPGSVAEQGYIDAFNRSEKIRLGMSYQNFDANSNDVGAYGQSFLFTEYLRTLCGDSVFLGILDYWRTGEDASLLTEGKAIRTQLSAEQIASLQSVCAYPDALQKRIGSEDEVLLSELALTFRLAMLLKEQSGLFAIGSSDPVIPVYDGSGRRIEGGGALLVECSGSFTIPADADSGMLFVGIKDDAVTELYTVPEPEEGFYVIAAQYNGSWYAIPGSPSANRILKAVSVTPNEDGSIDACNANGAIFFAEKTDEGFRFTCDDAGGAYCLSRSGASSQNLSVSDVQEAFSWSHFANGCDRLQGDGFYGRAILYGSFQGGFGYFPSGYFENASFAKPTLLRVSLMRGDANLDGKLTAADAAVVLRTVVGLSYMNAPMRMAGDLDGDGEITAADAAKILRLLVQIDA